MADTQGETHTVRFRGLALLFCVALAISGRAAAQSVMVDLGAEVVVLTQGATVGLPVTLSVPGEGPVEITLDVGYPGDVMTFTGAEPGFSVEASEADLRVQARPADGGEVQRVLAVEIKSAKPLTPGTLATLKFAFTSGAKPGTEVPILNLRRTARSAAGEDVNTRGAEGLITLVEPPAPCFFYMH